MGALQLLVPQRVSVVIPETLVVEVLANIVGQVPKVVALYRVTDWPEGQAVRTAAVFIAT